MGSTGEDKAAALWECARRDGDKASAAELEALCAAAAQGAEWKRRAEAAEARLHTALEQVRQVFTARNSPTPGGGLAGILAGVEGLADRAEQAERERDALLDVMLGPVGAEWFFIQKALGFPEDGMERGLTDIGDAAVMLRERCERAERERDEARIILSNITTECEHNAAMWREEKDARERAEADNAALLKALLDVAELRLCGATLDAMADKLRAEDHPGAALLERLRALEKVLSAFAQKEWARGDWQGFCPFRRHKDVVCMGTDGRVAAVGTASPVPHNEHCPYHVLHAADALKGET